MDSKETADLSANELKIKKKTKTIGSLPNILTFFVNFFHERLPSWEPKKYDRLG